MSFQRELASIDQRLFARWNNGEHRWEVWLGNDIGHHEAPNACIFVYRAEADDGGYAGLDRRTLEAVKARDTWVGNDRFGWLRNHRAMQAARKASAQRDERRILGEGAEEAADRLWRMEPHERGF